MRKVHVAALAATAAAGLCLTGPAHAEPSDLAPEVGWNYGELETARTLSLGGATRAVGYDINGLYANPASMAVTRVYHLGAAGHILPEAKRQSYGAAATDSITSRLAGGVGGTYTIQDSDGLKRKATDIRFALAYPVSEKLFLGMGGRYLRLQQDGFGPFGQSYASGGLENAAILSDFTFDAGVNLKPNRSLSIGLVGKNLTNPGHGFLPTSVGGGIGFGQRAFTLEADALLDFTTYDKQTTRVMVGGEFLAGQHFPIRLGYRFDEGQESHAISGGLGYIDQEVGVELGVRRNVSGPGSTMVVIGLQYFLESTGLTQAPRGF